MALFSKFFGKTISEAAAFALGGAIRSPLEPPLQELTNETWQRFVDAGITVPTEPGDAADIAAHDATLIAWAKDQASQRGYGGDQMDKLIEVSRTAPGMGELYQMFRRGDISPAEFEHGLRKQRLAKTWDAPLEKLRDARLSAEDVARMIQRGLIADPGILPEGPPSGVGNVKAFPVFDIPAYKEAAASGVDETRLGALTGLVGNPMGPHEAAQAEFRGILTDDDYRRAIAEGNTRNEWADAIREQARQIPTTHEFVENALRGYRTLEEAIAGGAKHGMSAEDVTLVYQNAGRPLNLHQITQAMAYGAKFNPEPGEITDPYMASIVEGSVKPGYYELQNALRYTLPSALYFRVLQTSGVLSQEQAKTWYLRLGWPPELADQVSKAFAKAKGAAAKEATVTDLLKLWDGGKATEAETLAAIEALGYPPDEAQSKLDTLDAARVVSAKSAAIGDLHTAYKKGALPDANAITALHSLGVHDWAAPLIVAAWKAYLTAEGAHPPATL